MIRRMFWVGVGVTITVVVIRRGKKVVAQYAPQAVVDRAERLANDAGRRAETFVGTFRSEFATARAAREAELTAALLAGGQPHPDDVRARRAQAPAGRHAAQAADVDSDEAELGYSF
jgi:hypothetical protein